jgi:hypothetical protein
LGFLVFVAIIALVIYASTRKGNGGSGGNSKHTGTWGGPVIISYYRLHNAAIGTLRSPDILKQLFV